MIDLSNKEKTKKLLSEQSELLKVIAHPVRLCILALLLKEQKSNVTSIQCCVDVPQPTISQHLAKLKASGIVSSERNGTEIIYELTNHEVMQIVELILQ